MRMVDDRLPGHRDLLRALWPHTGKAWIVGVTGNPGSGKSTSAIASSARTARSARAWASSPSTRRVRTRGAPSLGDRIRMSRHTTDDGVFIRSLATRGQLGGLSRSARDVIRVLDASGHDVVLVETVGVGQDELEITRTAHSTLVVVPPGLGDEVQAIKAGILECADVFAVNKADREGADAAVRDLELMIALGNESIRGLSKVRGHRTHTAADGHVGPAVAAQTAGGVDDERWTPPIVKCVATRGEGTDGLVNALAAHRTWLDGTTRGRERRRARLTEELRETLREALIDAAVFDLGPRIDAAVRDVEARAVDPYTATERLVGEFRTRS